MKGELQSQVIAILVNKLEREGITQAELAKRLGWSQKHMSSIFTCKAEPSIASLDFMAHILNIKFILFSEDVDK